MKNTRKKSTALALSLFLIASLPIMSKDKNLKVHYTFKNTGKEVVKDVSGNGYDGILKNSASLTKVGKYPVMDLGGDNGYLDMGDKAGELITSLEDFAVSTYLYIDEKTDVTKNGNFVYAFASLPECTQTEGEYIAYKVKLQRYEQSLSGWKNELVGVETGSPSKKGVWQHIVYVQSGKTGTLYINGKAAATSEAPLQPKNISKPTTYNWLGRAPFKNDVFLLNTLYHDFRIYNKALTESEISKLLKELEGLNGAMGK
ncbi:LamG domain-containing protein [Viscerimonas tarda]